MRWLFLAIVCGVLAAGVWGSRTHAMDTYLETREYEDLYYLPPASWLTVISLGHRAALADLIWMKGLIYVGDEFREQSGMHNIFHYCDAMIALDPDFRRAYTWTAVAGLYRPVEPTRADIETTIEVLRAGIARFPRDGGLRWDLGTTLFYELSRHYEGEEKDRVRAEGTRAMMEAAELGAGPEYLALSNASQLIRQGEIDMALRHLEEMYPLVDSEDTRATILAQIQRLRGAAEAEAIGAARSEFEADWRGSYPWLPASLYVHIGPSPVFPEGFAPHPARH